MHTQTIAQQSQYQLDETTAAPQAAQATHSGSQYTSGGQQQQTAPAAPKAAQRAERFFPEPTEGDKYLAASENFLIGAEKSEANLLRRLTGYNVEFQFRKPRDILKKSIPQPFNHDDAPPPISDFARAFSAATGFDQSGVIVSATTAAAAVIDDRYRLNVRPGTNWIVSARQWSFLCAGPSGGKSPILRASTDPIKRIHEQLYKQWIFENEGLDAKERTPMPALYTSDATVPALSERLKDNPRGLLMLNEEFSSWIGSIDSADRGEAAKNRGDWLQLRDGGSRQIDRIGRGSVFVPNWGASVMAACTPDGLRKQMKDMPEDGLIQRFIPCIMGAPDLDADGDCTEAIGCNSHTDATRNELMGTTFSGNRTSRRYSAATFCQAASKRSL